MAKTKVYAPPMSEFDMLYTVLEHEEVEQIEPRDGPSIVFVTGGAGAMTADGKTFVLKPGYVFFIAPGVGVEYKASGHDPFEVYAAVA